MKATNGTIAVAALVGTLLVFGGIRGQEKAAPGSPADAVLAYREAANLQNNGAFEVAAEEWQKFLKNHGKDPLAAKAQHYLGVCQLQLKQHTAAAASFEAVLKNHPKFELIEDAMFDLASSQYALAAGGQAETYAKASDTFGAIVDRFPTGKHREEALFYQGEALYALGKKAEAAAAYQRLIKDFEKSKRRAEALYALGVAQEELGQADEAGKTYDVFLRGFAANPLANEVRLRKGESLLLGGDVVGAERLFGELAAAKGAAATDHALSRQAFCLAKLEKFADAGGLYARLAKDFPESSFAGDAAISAGRCYYRANRAEEATQWLNKAVALRDSNSAEAAHWLCRLMIKSGQASGAVELAAKEAASAQGPFAANLLIDRADALYEMTDKRPEALSLYVKFVADHPRHELAPQALYTAGFTALGLKRYEDGLSHATRFFQAFPKHELDADVKYVAAECCLQLKEFEAAEKLYRQLVEQYSGHADADAWRLRLGHVAYMQKKYDAAVAAISPVSKQLKSADARAEAQFLIGASQFYQNQFAAAALSLTESLATSPKWRQADETLLLLTRAQAKDGRKQEAKANLTRLFNDHPASKILDEAHYRLGELCDGGEEFKSAIAEYDVVATKFPESQFAPYALYGRGWAQFKSKDFSNGAESFAALLARFPQHNMAADSQYGRALCLRQAGDTKRAIAAIDAYLKSNPDRSRKSDALYERGLGQVALKDFGGAVATLEGLLGDDPKFAAADKALYEIGWALKSQDKHAEAAGQFAMLAARHPSSALAAEAWFHVGEDHYEKKDFAAAERAYTNAKAKSTSGELAEKATYKLGWANFQLKDFADAGRQFDEQLAAFPQGPLAGDAAFMTAECVFRQEKFQSAWPAYQTAMQFRASTPTIEALTLLHAGQTAAQLKQWEESVKLLSQLAGKQHDTPLLPEALYERGWANQNLGKSDEALADYEIAATRSHDHVGARSRFMRGELLFSQKMHDEAGREFQRAMYGYGGDQATAETKNWQAKSGYEAGRCAEVQLAAATDAAAKQKHLADAKRCYAFVAEKHAQHELASEAGKRQSALSKLDASKVR